jgi:hypothetical protein
MDLDEFENSICEKPKKRELTEKQKANFMKAREARAKSLDEKRHAKEVKKAESKERRKMIYQKAKEIVLEEESKPDPVPPEPTTEAPLKTETPWNPLESDEFAQYVADIVSSRINQRVEPVERKQKPKKQVAVKKQQPSTPSIQFV